METPRPCSPLAQMESQAFDEVIYFLAKVYPKFSESSTHYARDRLCIT